MKNEATIINLIINKLNNDKSPMVFCVFRKTRPISEYLSKAYISDSFVNYFLFFKLKFNLQINLCSYRLM